MCAKYFYFSPCENESELMINLTKWTIFNFLSFEYSPTGKNRKRNRFPREIGVFKDDVWAGGKDVAMRFLMKVLISL